MDRMDSGDKVMDPRLEIIQKRTKDIRRVIAVAGGKGGIGKSSVASVLALVLARSGHRVGLLDLDFSGPSDHVILGIKAASPQEDKGLIPPLVHGIRFMSIVYFAGDHPSPLRGEDISNALIELFTVTLWGNLDVLVIDMPPGIGDATLDLVRLVPKVEFLILTTPSRVALETVQKLVLMLSELKIPILGIIENMKTTEHALVRTVFEPLHVPLLGELKYDEKLEEAIGDVEKLWETCFVKELQIIVSSHFH